MMAARSANPRVAAATDAAAGSVETLAAAERAFSARSVASGMKDAFLTYLGPGAVIFRPDPVEGRPVWEARKASPPGTLSWDPEFIEVSLAGDLGVSTGPWEYRPNDETDPAKFAFGDFISIWKRPPDGEWRVALDLGIDHDRPAAARAGALASGPSHPRVRVTRGGPTRAGDLAKLDGAFGRASAKGLARGLARVATDDVRFNRTGGPPALGLAAARASADSLRGRWSFDTRGSGVALMDDFAYTYGLATRFAGGKTAPPDTNVYLHVWRRDARNRWKLSLAVLNPKR